MKKAIIIVIIAIPLLSFKIKPVFFIRKDIKIESLLVLPPVSSILVINSSTKQEIDKTLSQETFYNTSLTLQKSFPDSVKTDFFKPDSIMQLKLVKWVSHLNSIVKNQTQAKKYKLPDSIFNLFDTAKINFVFCTNIIGFKRTRTNLVNTELASEIADALVGFPYRPLETTASMSCFILDLRQKNIVYFARDLWKNKDPTNKDVIKLQLTRLIMHYFI